MPTPLEQIFATARDPLVAQQQQLENIQRGAAQFKTPGGQVGFALGGLAQNLFRRFKTGEKGEGVVHRLRTGDPNTPQMRQVNATDRALSEGAVAAGPQRPDETPEAFQLRQIESVNSALMSLDPSEVDGKVLQEVNAARSSMAAQAEAAAEARESNDQSREIRDIQIRSQRHAFEQNVLEGRQEFLLDKESGEFIGVYDASKPQEDAQLDQLVQSNPDRFLPMTRDQVVAMENTELTRNLARAEIDTVSKRKLSEQAFALQRSLTIGSEIMDLFADGDFSANTIGERIRGGLFNLGLQAASVTDAFRTASANGTLGQVQNQDGTVTDISTNVDKYLESNSELLQAMEESGINRAVLDGLSRNLAYAVARANDPSGRLSDFDVEISMRIIGAALTNPQSLGQNLRAVLFTSGGSVLAQIDAHQRVAEESGVPLDPLLRVIGEDLRDGFEAFDKKIPALPGDTRNRVNNPADETADETETPTRSDGTPVQQFDFSGAFE
jgi:hypothetical protein